MKTVLLKLSQILQENTSAGVSFFKNAYFKQHLQMTASVNM